MANIKRIHNIETLLMDIANSIASYKDDPKNRDLLAIAHEKAIILEREIWWEISDTLPYPEDYNLEK